MKKLVKSALALATILFASSCMQESLEPAQNGSTVTFTVEVPETVATKAFGDGTNINNLVYAVYKTEENDLETAASAIKPEDKIYDFIEDVSFVDSKTTVSLELINDQKYIVLFWAQHGQTWIQKDKEFDLTNITYPTHEPLLANNDKYSAFSGAAFVEKVDGARTDEVTLTRPFAQINIAAADPVRYDVDVISSKVKVIDAAKYFNVATQTALLEDKAEVEYAVAANPEGGFNDYEHYVAMNYVFANGNVSVAYEINTEKHGTISTYDAPISNVPVAKNYRTNIVGNLLTSNVDYNVELDQKWGDEDFGSKYGEIDGQKYVAVETVEEFNEAFVDPNIDIIILTEDVVVTETLTHSTTDVTLAVAAGKNLTIDLNGKKISSTSTQTGGNYNMFDVQGTLTVKSGTIEYEHLGENMGWGASTNIFNVTAGGVLNLEGVTAKNLGGSDMGFVAHLNNWGEVTLNVENCTLESNYVPVRVFNSGNDMNNVTIKNSNLTGVSAAFWVHNYTVADFGSEAKAETQKSLLNLNIYNQGNTFSPDLNGIRYGFTNSVRSDAYGITKSVSEDGTEVTLGSVVEDGLVRRGVAGTEENTTIKKVVVEEGITTLYDRTFRRFYALETVELPSTLTTIGAAGSGVFQSCTALKNITLPESVTVLGKGSFQECSSLESINIPSGVTRIEADALRATGLVSVEFHEGVTYFGAQAFRDCKQLTEVIINAPEFTMEGNTFGITAAPFTPMTIYVANGEMKTYVESKLTDHAKTYITVVAPTVPTTGADADAALKEGENVTLDADLEFSASETEANSGYGATGLTVNGSVFNGNGHVITVNDAWGTWDCNLNAQSGTIKNVTVSGAMRGIFMGGANGDVYIDKVIFDNVIYTFNSDGGNKNYGVYISNSTLNGWTSFSNAHKEVVFTNCSFGEGNGYAFCRPYNPCVFENCEFSTDMQFDTTQQANIVFKNCTYGGVKITAENAASLKTGDTTFFYNGVGTVSFE